MAPIFEGEVRYLTRVNGASAWYSADYNDKRAWIHGFSVLEVAEIDAAVASVHARNLSTEEVRLEDFVLPTLGNVLRELQRDVLHGRGFVLLRGLPVERYTLR